MNLKKGLRLLVFLLRTAALLWVVFFGFVTAGQGGLLWVNYGEFILWRVLAPAFGVLVIAWLIARLIKE